MGGLEIHKTAKVDKVKFLLAKLPSPPLLLPTLVCFFFLPSEKLTLLVYMDTDN